MSSPIVQVNEGQLKGSVVKNVDGGEYYSFRGVPYAEPPIGDLRFREPRRPKPWSGIRDVGNVSPKATQYDLFMGIESGNEDCLYLNIATNSLSGKRPVMVWIHGGGFVMGGPIDFSSPDYLLKHDVVFVDIAYRLGCFGFLNLDIPEAAGNQGVKDQIAALKWIQENIKVFGGDPDNVTLFGTSAGSASCHILCLSPLAKGLFHKVSMQSGSCINPWSFQDKPVECALRLSALVGEKKIDDPKEAWKFLMSATTNQLIEAQRKIISRNIVFELVFHFVPSIDNSSLTPLIPEHPSLIAKRGIDIPMIIGFNSDEGIITTLDPQIEDRFIEINNNFTHVLGRHLNIFDTARIEKIANSVRKYYFGEGALTLRTKKKEYAKFEGDIKIINGIQEVVDLQIEKSTPTYLYKFSYIFDHPTLRTIMRSNLEGACHGDETGALFHIPPISQTSYKMGSRDRLIMERMTRMWTNFAKTGNPTPDSDEVIKVQWKPVKKNEKNYLAIDDTFKIGTNPNEDACNFWKNILDTLLNDVNR